MCRRLFLYNVYDHANILKLKGFLLERGLWWYSRAVRAKPKSPWIPVSDSQPHSFITYSVWCSTQIKDNAFFESLEHSELTSGLASGMIFATQLRSCTGVIYPIIHAVYMWCCAAVVPLRVPCTTTLTVVSRTALQPSMRMRVNSQKPPHTSAPPDLHRQSYSRWYWM